MPQSEWHRCLRIDVPTLLLGWLLFPLVASAHEPLFSLGAQVIYRYGWGIETGVATERVAEAGREEEEWTIAEEIAYGVTRNFTMTLQIPYRFKEAETAATSGFGDVSLRAKYRFFQTTEVGLQHHAALLAGIKLPTGSTTKDPRLGTGSVDFLAGLTASRDGRRYYTWGSLLGRVNTRGAGDRTRGNLLSINVAAGVRPYLPEFYDPDLLLLTEVNLELRARDTINGTGIANSGGTRLFISPGFWFTYRNIAVKGGVQLPLLQDLRGDQAKLDYRAVLAVEVHF